MQQHAAFVSGVAPTATVSPKGPKALRIIATFALVFGVWVYARLAPDASERVVAGAFSSPQVFFASPAAPYSIINVRSGPGGEYRVREQVARGGMMFGIARTTDQRGQFWIELAGGRGYAKETVLSTTAPGPPPQ